MPNEVKRAQVFAAYEVTQGESLQATDSGRSIASESIGPLSVSYFDNNSTETRKIFTRAISELSAVLVGAGSIPLVRT